MSKTIFCDIDGTIFKHKNCFSRTEDSDILDDVLSTFEKWDKNGHKIILTTGRRESEREITKKQLLKYGIIFDQLIMGLPRGERVLINDKKKNSPNNNAFAINLTRNDGFKNIQIDNTTIIGINDKKLVFTPIEKPWGSEELLEINDNYIVKKLFMKKGHRCSLQYHKTKKETVYVLSGVLKLYIGPTENSIKEIILKPSDHITINPYTIHRMEGIEDSLYLESSTNQFYDVVRLSDDYNRN